MCIQTLFVSLNEFFVATDGLWNAVEALSVTFAALVAWKGIDAWRKEMIGRRKSEIAEETLAVFYETKEVFKDIRSPLTYSAEAEDRPKAEGESDSEKRKRDTFFIPIARTIRHKEHFARLRTLKYKFMAYFGAESSKPFDTIFSIKHSIVVDAEMLAEEDAYDPYEKDFKKNLKMTIGWGLSKDDTIRNQIDEAINAIEAICGSYLQERG